MIIYYNAKKGKRKIFHESSKPTPTKKNQIFYFIIFTFVNESIPFKASNVNYFDLILYMRVFEKSKYDSYINGYFFLAKTKCQLFVCMTDDINFNPHKL